VTTEIQKQTSHNKDKGFLAKLGTLYLVFIEVIF